MQSESRDRMHEQRLAERRAGTRLSTEPHRGFHVHERQRHELGEAAARALLLTRTQKMARPVARALHVTEHHRHVRAETHPVRDVVDAEPLFGRDLVRADDLPHLVVENLGRGPGQRAEPRLSQLREVVLECYLERRRPLPDLERRERVHVQAGNSVFDRPDDGEVVVAGERGMDPALEAHLGRPALPGFLAAPHDLLVRHEVRCAA